MLLAIDGAARLGWALFDVTDGSLYASGAMPFERFAKRGLEDRLGMMLVPCDRIVIEAHHARKRERDPNRILTLAWTCGEIAGICRERYGVVPEKIYESTWKGSVDKTIHNARVRRHLGWPDDRGTPDELDAIGLGVFAFQRIKL